MYLDASITMEMICFDSLHNSALRRLKLKTAQYLSKYGSSQWLDTQKEGDTNNDVFGIFLYEPELIFIISSSVVIIALTFIANNTKILVYEMNQQ